MITVIVEHPVNRKPKKSPLVWYDPEKKKMLAFDGDRLDFKRQYDDELKKYRVLPSPASRKSNEEMSVTDWHKIYVRQYGNKVVCTQDQRRGMHFNVPDDELDDFMRSARKHKLKTRVL